MISVPVNAVAYCATLLSDCMLVHVGVNPVLVPARYNLTRTKIVSDAVVHSADKGNHAGSYDLMVITGIAAPNGHHGNLCPRNSSRRSISDGKDAANRIVSAVKDGTLFYFGFILFVRLS